MSGMAGNVTAFATVWTYDIYRPYFNKRPPTGTMSRWGGGAPSSGVLISIGAAYLVMQFDSIMDYMQALFGFFIAPLFGTVLLGMLWKRVTSTGGFLGLLAGTVSSVAMFTLMKLDPERWVEYSRFPRLPRPRAEYVSGDVVVHGVRSGDGPCQL